MIFFEKYCLKIQRYLAFFVSVWCVHCGLRVVHLIRLDAFGFPIVSKFDWYIFHAISIDAQWIFVSALPLFLIVVWVQNQKTLNIIYWLYIICHSILLLLTVFNNEFYRFMGTHFTIDLLRVYGNTAAVLELGGLLSEDQSIPYLPVVLFLGVLPSLWIVYKYIKILVGKSPVKSVIIIVLFVLITWIFTDWAWKGGFREKRLMPVYKVFWNDIMLSKDISIDDETYVTLVHKYQNQWQKEQRGSDWKFVSMEYPYVRMPLIQYCNNNMELEQCNLDKDGDSFFAYEDCDDTDKNIHRNALEIPSNGIDEDCSGLDLKPWNYVFIILESHRALNVGFLKEYGAIANGTPYLNRLADSSHVWVNYTASGIPTIAALTTMHLSTYEHPYKLIATSYTQNKNRSFVNILRDHGYKSHFFSSADPAWDNQIPWLRQWYGSYTYSRTREDDIDMFRYMKYWMKDSLSNSQPFIITAITKTNHYPFNKGKYMEAHSKGASLLERMSRNMAYTEKGLEELIEGLRDESWFDRTIFVITADHGFPLGEHGSSSMGWGMYIENTWVPLLIYGNHPKLSMQYKHHHTLAGHVDIGPTLLDFSGIRDVNHFVGHSLLEKDTIEARSLVIGGKQASLGWGDWRAHTGVIHFVRPQSKELFQVSVDPLEQKNLVEKHPEVTSKLVQDAKDATLLNTYLIEQNKIWEPNSF